MRSALLALAPLLASSDAPNVLIVMLDDWGVDRCAVYGEHPFPGRTPTIDALAAQGMLFRTAWTSTVCSPTRALLLTGRHGFRTGIGKAVQPESVHDLLLPEVTLPEALPASYVSGAVGKWHLASDASGPLHPNLQGFDLFLGHIFNVRQNDPTHDYFTWEKTSNGYQEIVTRYLTTDQVDDAVRMVNQLPAPWLVYLSLQAPHGPFHAPPDELHTFNLSGDPADTIVKHYKAMVEAADTELARLLARVDLAETYVFLLGDNGTPGKATSAPFIRDHAKGGLYEGGIRVPFIVAGPGVPPGTTSGSLVWAGDIFATVLGLAQGGDPTGVTDSESLLPTLADPSAAHREFLYAERFDNGPALADRRQAVRGARFKLIRRPGGEEFFDLDADPFEWANIPPGQRTQEQQDAYGALAAEMDAVGG